MCVSHVRAGTMLCSQHLGVTPRARRQVSGASAGAVPFGQARASRLCVRVCAATVYADHAPTAATASTASTASTAPTAAVANANDDASDRDGGDGHGGGASVGNPAPAPGPTLEGCFVRVDLRDVASPSRALGPGAGSTLAAPTGRTRFATRPAKNRHAAAPSSSSSMPSSVAVLAAPPRGAAFSGKVAAMLPSPSSVVCAAAWDEAVTFRGVGAGASGFGVGLTLVVPLMVTVSITDSGGGSGGGVRGVGGCGKSVRVEASVHEVLGDVLRRALPDLWRDLRRRLQGSDGGDGVGGVGGGGGNAAAAEGAGSVMPTVSVRLGGRAGACEPTGAGVGVEYSAGDSVGLALLHGRCASFHVHFGPQTDSCGQSSGDADAALRRAGEAPPPSQQPPAPSQWAWLSGEGEGAATWVVPLAPLLGSSGSSSGGGGGGGATGNSVRRVRPPALVLGFAPQQPRTGLGGDGPGSVDRLHCRRRRRRRRRSRCTGLG